MGKLEPINKGRGWKTAIGRKVLSVPMKELVKNFFPENLEDLRCLDFGCGRGQDADALGFEKFDPNWGPEMPDGEFDLITCNYVLNVIPFEDRGDIIQSIQKKLKPDGIAYVSVRADVKVDTETQFNVSLLLPLIYKGKGCRIYEVKK